jgi:predicted esterase
MEKADVNQDISIFYGQGDCDPVVVPQLAYLSRSRLEQQGYKPLWHEYRGMQHSVSPQEIRDISAWLQQVLVK